MYCGALKWVGEAPGMCCAGGKVSLTPLQPPPEPLALLMSGTTPRSKHFLEHIRKYNCCFQMTSFGATNEVCEPGFMPTFKVQGQIYHRVGSLLPLANQQHQFLQILELQQMLHEHNNYVHMFKSALQRMPSDAYKVVISTDKRPAGEHE
jgi:hypothetical protein